MLFYLSASIAPRCRATPCFSTMPWHPRRPLAYGRNSCHSGSADLRLRTCMTHEHVHMTNGIIENETKNQNHPHTLSSSTCRPYTHLSACSLLLSPVRCTVSAPWPCCLRQHGDFVDVVIDIRSCQTAKAQSFLEQTSTNGTPQQLLMVQLLASWCFWRCSMIHGPFCSLDTLTTTRGGGLLCSTSQMRRAA